MIPVVGDTVQYTRRVTPREGPAIGGKIEIHAGVVLRVSLAKACEVSSYSPSAWAVDLRVMDEDGDFYIVRKVPHATFAGTEEAVGSWSGLPSSAIARIEQLERVLGLKKE